MKKTKSTNSHPSHDPRIPNRIPRVPCGTIDHGRTLSTGDALLAGAAVGVLVTVAARGLRRILGQLDGQRATDIARAAYVQLGQVLASVVPPNGGA
jgi:hypothetical protein